MRLSRPTLLSRPASLLFDEEPASTAVPTLRGCLAIPATFGAVNVGETLRCCISLANISPGDVSGVTLRCELHVSSGALTPATRRAVLLDTTTAASTVLRTGDRADYSVSHILAEPGQHVMVCIVSYTRPVRQQQQPLSPTATTTIPSAIGLANAVEETGFKKYFSFKVGHCVDARARVVEVANTVPKKWLVEAQVEVLSNVFLEVVTVDPPDNCIAAPFDSGLLNGVGNVSASAEPAQDGFPAHLPRLRSLQQYMRAGSQVRRVFELTQRNRPSATTSVSSPSLGRLLVSWRSTGGEPGRLQLPIVYPGQQQQSHHHQLVPIEMRVAEPDVNTVARLLAPFAMRCILTNRAAAAMLVRISFVADSAGVVLVGTRNDQTPIELQPGVEHEFRCSLLPLQPGVQRLGALSILDVRGNHELFFPDLGSVVVHKQQQS